MVDPLFFLIFGHLCGDFALQSDRMARDKQHSVLVLTWHVLVYTTAVALCLLAGLWVNNSWSIGLPMFVTILGIVFFGHWLQDFVKPRRFVNGKQGFYLDQAIHIAILIAIRIAFIPG